MSKNESQLLADKLITKNIDIYQITQLNSYKKLKIKTDKKPNLFFKRIFSYDFIFLLLINFIFAAYLFKFFHYYYYESELLDLTTEFHRLFSYLVALWFKFNKFDVITKEECALPLPEFLNSITRPISDCNMCVGLNDIPSVDYISKEMFLHRHAYTGVPLLVKQAASNWSATSVFDFEFFKDLYLNKVNIGWKKKKKSRKMSYKEVLSKGFVEFQNERVSDDYDSCQFFGYKTKFKSLVEFFNMDIDNLVLESRNFKPWYIGWYAVEK